MQKIAVVASQRTPRGAGEAQPASAPTAAPSLQDLLKKYGN
jgi:hypothetical protein